jgi:uncharacterized protein YjbI with pentapeptide repeats
LLRENVNDWNNWRKACLEIPDLSKAVFHKLDLTNANLSHVDLRGAEFHDCLLGSASFESAQLQDVKFGSIKCSDQVNFLYAQMSRSRMMNCKWRNSSFNNAICVKATIEECKFYSCNFVFAELTEADWSDCLLQKCNFRDAKLIGARFNTGNTMHCCVLTDADFAAGDFRGLFGCQFDHNNVQGTLVAPRAQDDWSKLRRSYTGSRLIFNLIFLAFFFAPVVAKTVFWMEVSRLEAHASMALSAINRLADDLERSSGEVGREMAQALRRAIAAVPVLRKEAHVDQALPYWLAAQLREDSGTVGRLLGAALESSLASSAPAQGARKLLEQVADELARKPEAEGTRMADALRQAAAKIPDILPKAPSRLIWVILGLNVPWDRVGIFDIVGAISGILLIIYNGARALLTFFVTQLRDEEQVSNHTPRRRSPWPSARIKPTAPGKLTGLKVWVWSCWGAVRRLPDVFRESYAWLKWPRRVVSGLECFAYGATAVHIYNVASSLVVLPT